MFIRKREAKAEEKEKSQQVSVQNNLMNTNQSKKEQAGFKFDKNNFSPYFETQGRKTVPDGPKIEKKAAEEADKNGEDSESQGQQEIAKDSLSVSK